MNESKEKIQFLFEGFYLEMNQMMNGSGGSLMNLGKLDDTPMFRTQLHCLEENAELLKERSLKFYKGCHKYTEGLGEGYDGDITFANALETFGGGNNDPLGASFGGPIMSKFTIALREIGTYKEVLRSQVENLLNVKLLQVANVDLPDVKEARKRFDKATNVYDQAREKFLSLKKTSKKDTIAATEEELNQARAAYEQARFNLIYALSNVEAKKRYEFLEAVSRAMDAHLHYFKQGYELLNQMEPYIKQVLSYVEQSRQSFNNELTSLNEKMQEYKSKIDNQTRQFANGSCDSPVGDSTQSLLTSSVKPIEEVMQSSANGKVQIIREGYLFKRSSNLRGDWKRRFFVLDSRGMLYYYRKPRSKSAMGAGKLSGLNNPPDPGSGVLGRWLSAHAMICDERTVARHTVNLLTATIKMDAEQSDLRFCFRIISPAKTYTLQAENTSDQMDWIEKIRGVTASLLNTMAVEGHVSTKGDQKDPANVIENGSCECYANIDYSVSEDGGSRKGGQSVKPMELLRKVLGNNKCADCDAPEPDWASLNLGILVCIECSGVHRNLGVHISKVRSLTLDVKVWEPSILSLFQSLGNIYANSIWEEFLHSRNSKIDERPVIFQKSEKHTPAFMKKPTQHDSAAVKELFIHAKYEEKIFVRKTKRSHQPFPVSQQMSESIRANNKRAVYRLIVCSGADVNAVHQESSTSFLINKLKNSNENSSANNSDSVGAESVDRGPESAGRGAASSLSMVTKGKDSSGEDSLNGSSLLHLACQFADIGMVELLLQYGADMNAVDLRGQTPLHHCITRQKADMAKLLIMRGANTKVLDKEGKSAMELAEESELDDDELLALLRDNSG